MATEPHPTPSTAPTWTDSPIENELPTYRAISTWAVASVVLGVLSLISFASLSFVVASAAAIAAGALAQRSIRRYPDLLTGSGLANFGIALGLISGLAAPTIFTVQHTLIGREARAYADQLASTLQERGLADAFFISQHPVNRAGRTPQEVLNELESSPEQQMMMGPDDRLGAFRGMAQRLTNPNQHIHVDEIESRGFSGTIPYAYVRVMLDGPETDEFPAVQFALMRVEGYDGEGARQWYVKELVFPYEAGSQANVVESAHGHDH